MLTVFAINELLEARSYQAYLASYRDPLSSLTQEYLCFQQLTRTEEFLKQPIVWRPWSEVRNLDPGLFCTAWAFFITEYIWDDPQIPVSWLPVRLYLAQALREREIQIEQQRRRLLPPKPEGGRE